MRRPTGDDGLALVLVMGIASILGGLLAVGTAVGVRALQSSTSHAAFESALAVAEAGIDQTLSQVQQAARASTVFTNTAPCAVTAPATFASAEAERTWARDALLALPTSCLRRVGGGEYAAVRPSSRQVVYSMGWVPSRAATTGERRLLKSEYLFAPYRPTKALLTEAPLDISGSLSVTTLTGSPADVHSNADVTGPNGSTQIAGNLSAVGSIGSCPAGITAGCTPAAPRQQIPTVSAAALYGQSLSYASVWYDLCPDGVMRRPGTTPCTGTALSTTNGWTFTPGSGTTPPTWVLPRTAGGPFDGIYYVRHGNAQIGNNGNSSQTWRMTVLAEAQTGTANAATCNTLGGEISWKLFNMTPFLPGLQLLADTRLVGSANADAGPGLFLAGHNVDLRTSSSTLSGAVIAANTCPAAGNNTLQGITLRYDDTAESPLKDTIRTTLWLDYASG